MTKTFFKKYRTAFVSAAVLLAGYVTWACAGGDWEDGSDSNYTPEVFIDSAYKPFLYSQLFAYYDIGYDTDHNQRFNDENIKAWTSYLGNVLHRDELDFLLHQSSVGYIDSILLTWNGKIKGNLLREMPQIADKGKNEKLMRFVTYLSAAKRCESFAVKYVDYWSSDEDAKTPASGDARLLEDLKKQFKDSKDGFLRERYWFQLVRYYYYFNPAAAIALFEEHRRSFPVNTIYYRTMAAAAGALYKQKNYARANYYYSLVFAGSDKLKTVAHWSFHPQDESDWKQTLALCTNTNEQATLWQMLGIFYKDEIRSMREIYKLDPKSPMLDLLLTRFVNKNENEYSFFQDQTNSRARIKEALSWITEVADKNVISNPFLWNISTGYLYFLTGDYAASEKYYQKASVVLPRTTLASNQLRLLSVLTKVGALSTIRRSDEDRLLPDLQWLYHLNDSIAGNEFRYQEGQRWIRNTLAKKYRQQKDFTKAECFETGSSFYTSNANVEQLKTLFTKNNRTSFESFCMEMSEKKLSDCWAFEAIVSAYNDRIDEAILQMEKAPGNGAIMLAGNPFNNRIADCHDCDHMAPQKIKYTKLAFLKKLKEMKDNVKAGTDVYNNALLLGNAFYNMSHYGNARIFYESAVLGTGHYSPFAIDSVFVPLLTSNTRAKEYYQLALDNAADDEQRAKCIYMITKCNRNEGYNRNYFSNRENEYKYDDNYLVNWSIYEPLQAYSRTKYYQEVLKECGYFNTYVQRKK
jgi:hypothetical protein